jgi:hypothetical protein
MLISHKHNSHIYLSPIYMPYDKALKKTNFKLKRLKKIRMISATI